jgi:myo-inositol-1(or 4)-monophosphatase
MIIDEVGIDQREAVLRALVKEAAAIAVAGYQKQAGEVVSMKGPQDFLTETDGRVEEFIRNRIAVAFPEDGFLGEEGGGSPGQQAWVVDPIDGTANFARNIPHFCISIAFVANGETQLGVVVNPVLDELYFARRNRGATLNGRAIKVSATTHVAASSVELGWSNRRPLTDYISAVRSLFEAGSNVRRASCGALGLAYVADGRSDAYGELHMNSWDCLAGLLLVREAGGLTGPFLSVGGLIHGAPVLAAAPGSARVMSEATGIPLLVGGDMLPDLDNQRRTA